jgi:hypothetical protein
LGVGTADAVQATVSGAINAAGKVGTGAINNVKKALLSAASLPKELVSAALESKK